MYEPYPGSVRYELYQWSYRRPSKLGSPPPEAVTVREAAQALGCSNTMAHAVLDKLWNMGRVKRQVRRSAKQGRPPFEYVRKPRKDDD